ncbi:MAG: SDR family oxidoreductase [Microthrixaceae bacterium]|nr:SDR family oxidoreductase [Microthrixaceae bacterium]MCO5313824.1 SDR family oxidoreductase [Microthrixaceae bacterium]
MRVVLTGGAGFLGYHLSSHLLNRGDEVVCVDNLSSGQRSNIEALSQREGFEFIEADASLPFKVDGRVDAVMHFASPASPRDYLGDPFGTMQVGSNGTFHTLELARANGARFMVASTSEIYGDPTVHPQPESYWGNVNPIGPRSVYDESKRFAETVTAAYRRIHGVDTAIVRYFNTYGPRMRAGDGRVVSNFIVQALLGRPITIYGDGSQTRSFGYVDDTVDGTIRFLDSGHPGPMNIGSHFEFTMLELASLVLELTGAKSELVFEPLPEDDPTQRRADTSLAKSELDWEPTTSLRDGLTATIEWFASLQAAGHDITPGDQFIV